MDDRNDGETGVADVAPLSPEQFYVLYQGVLRSESDEQFHRDALLVFGLGRLGLCRETLLHLHEGWIDWRRGAVVVPSHDPCACRRCVEAVRAETTVEDDQLGNLSLQRNFRPPHESAARAVPFSWSRRLTCALMNFFDRFDYPEFEEPIEERLDVIAGRVPGLEASAVTATVLRATAAKTLADLGFQGGALRDVTGAADVEDVNRFARQSPVWTETDPPSPTAEFRSRYRVVGNPEPFADEPWDPTTYGAESRFDRAKRNESSSLPATSPRPTSVPADPAASSPGPLEYLDPDSELVSTGTDPVESFLGAWVKRHDSRDSPADFGVDDDARTAGAGPDAAGPDAAGPHSNGDSPGGESARPSGGTGADAGRPPDSKDEDDVGLLETPVSEVIETPVAEYSAEYVSSLVTGSKPVSGAVVLGPERVAFDVSGAPVERGVQSFVLPLETLRDFSFDYQPEDVPGFESVVGLAVSWEDRQETVAVDFRADKNEFAADLLAVLFDGSEVVVTYPLREGGRVNEDASPEGARLRVSGSTLAAYPPGTDAAAGDVDGDGATVVVPLSRVSAVDKATQTYDAKTIPSVEVQFSTDGDTETVRFGVQSERLARLLLRLVRVHYRLQRQRMRELSLDPGEKQFLVGLHSMGAMAGGGTDLEGMLGIDTDDFEGFVRGLEEKGLVETGESGTDLTHLGRTVVNEKIDDVNF